MASERGVKVHRVQWIKLRVTSETGINTCTLYKTSFVANSLKIIPQKANGFSFFLLLSFFLSDSSTCHNFIYKLSKLPCTWYSS